MVKKIKSKELSLLSNQLYLMIDAGIIISEAFYLTASMEKNEILKKKLILIYDDILKGEELYKSIEKHQDIFPVFFIQMIRLGEHTGNLEGVLKNLYEFYERDNKLYNKLKSSMTYPLIVFITSILAILILMIKVVPQFTDTLISLGGNLPGITSMMLLTCGIFKENYIVIIIIFFIIVTLVRKINKTQIGREKLQSLKLKIPIFRCIYEKIILSKFSRSMGILISSGCNLISSFEICSEIIDNIVFKKALGQCLDKIKNGKSMTYAFSSIGINNPLFISLIRTGEETGELDKVLKKAADFYDNELEELSKRLLTILEPVLVIIMAAIIGTFIIAIMLPILNIMDAIK